jgi:hypothetical protein
MTRVIDEVDEAIDREDPEEDWSLLATPFAEVLKVEATADLAALYIRQPARENYPVLSSKIDVERIRILPADVIDVRAKLTSHRNKPVVLVGEAGVGKTSWFKYFYEVVLKDDRFIPFYYDQKVDFHVPLGLKLKPKDKFEKIFWYKMIDALKEELEKRSITGTWINQIESEYIIDYGNPESLKLYKRFAIEIKRIYEEKGLLLFVLIDNLDQFDAELQKRAFELSVWLGALKGVVSFVTLRPDTMNDHLFEENVHNPIIYQIPPPSLQQLIDSRLNYLWSNAGQSRLEDIRRILSNDRITLNLSYTGLIERSEQALKAFHQNIRRALCDNSLLENALYSLHNYNIRTVSIILSSIVLTRYFSGEFKEGIADEPIPHLRKPEKLVTAYLRGIYGHYRGGTKAYPVANISLFADLYEGSDLVILGVRIMQIIMNRKSANSYGVEYAEILSVLTTIGYEKYNINRCLCMMYKRGFIAETSRQAKILASKDIENKDRFRLQPTGDFLLNNLLSLYAFRYCEAVADICPHSRPDGKGWATDKSFVSMVENAFGVLELFIASAEKERDMAKQRDYKCKSHDAEQRLEKEFYENVGDKDEILHTMISECVGRVKFFSIESGTRKNFDAVTVFRVILDNRVPKIKARLKKLKNFN